jgi:hypothetical protein
VYVISWTTSSFVLEPQGILAQSPPPGDLPMAAISGSPPASPYMCSTTVKLPPSTKPGTWTFKLKAASALDWKSLTSSQVADVILQLDYSVS